MAVQTGGGAATLGGAAYQSTVAAFFILSMICDFETELFGADRPTSFSFETANSVDDINIGVGTNSTAYLQVKRKLSFSLAIGHDLYECLDQFVRQSLEDRAAHSFAIVTTSESSRRVTVSLPSVVSGIQSGSEADFRRDQNKALVRDFDLLVGTLKKVHESHAGKPLGHTEALDLLKKLRVCTLDLMPRGSIEQAAYIALSARGCVSPPLFWGNLIADCASFSAARRSVTARFLIDRYSRFFSIEELPPKIDDAASAKKFFEVASSGEIPTGREIVIGKLVGPRSAKKALEGVAKARFKETDLTVFEFYRFDDNCNERIKFSDGKCILQNGLEIELWGRFATYQGLDRYIERQQQKIESESSRLFFLPANIKENPELGECAIARRELLEASIKDARRSFACVRCEKPISSNAVDFIEYEQDGRPQVGLSHHACTRTDDRVIGSIYSELFKQYDFLRHFDAATWLEKIQRGQGAYGGLEATKAFNRVMTWSGRSARNSTGTHIVEFDLEDGTSEFGYHRGQLDRYSKAKADKFCADMNKWIAAQKKKKDPLCLSENTLQFGSRSVLLQTVGAGEKLKRILKGYVKKYHSSIAQRYDIHDNWFAPVAYIRALPDENPLGIGPSLFLITQPFHLDRFLANWRECGLQLGDYEVPILATDEQFDEFAREIFDRDERFLIDPLFLEEDGHLKLVSGVELISLAKLTSSLSKEEV